MRSIRRCLLIMLLALVVPLSPACVHATAPLRVIYPRAESQQDARQRYPLEVLRLALARSGVAYRLQPSRTAMQQARSLRMLASGHGLDVVWTVTTRERERRLRAIRIPIDRGLIGWRVLLVHRGDRARFARIDRVRQLAALRAGQGHDWPDLAILRANGLQVDASATYEGLFQMLARRHIDYFPRSIAEVDGELNSHAGLPIELEPHLLLHYPSALYFFVRPHNVALADAIRRGLERSLDDGSLLRLFHRTYDADLDRLDLARRTILELRNPDFPDDAPLQNTALWFHPKSHP
ncbi:hypothetical protein [Oleiagrimonas soli]|uniref:Solute-binding protein family 3/N-terminal domain-containing protein n=1 Tax=Oleiagrimonas soli TaxID=1543381 RepID=A0A099CZ18_9GAMM|nr:hypothetical protein [Oleiagrimonas soli]KGI78857.1 hypothetical protein LF63_0102705 [Oleiagrimonas soli]MBB6184344.1 hypothetical protein [Oleiagrimonas soli]